MLGLASLLPYGALVAAGVVSRASAMGAIMCLYLFTPEAYPTTVRNQALGLGSAVSRVAGIATSYLAFRSAAGGTSQLADSEAAIFTYAGAAALAAMATALLRPGRKAEALDAE